MVSRLEEGPELVGQDGVGAADALQRLTDRPSRRCQGAGAVTGVDMSIPIWLSVTARS